MLAAGPVVTCIHLLRDILFGWLSGGARKGHGGARLNRAQVVRGACPQTPQRRHAEAGKAPGAQNGSGSVGPVGS